MLVVLALLATLALPDICNGTVAGVILVFRDITQRRQAEAKLHASEKRFRIAQEISLDVRMELPSISAGST